jgi:hypothetical protein
VKEATVAIGKVYLKMCIKQEFERNKKGECTEMGIFRMQKKGTSVEKDLGRSPRGFA